MRRTLLVAFAASLLLPSLAFAQQPGCINNADVDPATVSLNQGAQKAMKAKEYKKALRLLRSSLDVEETNLTWLNYGYVLAQLGYCDEAVKAYQKVRTATPICGVPTADVEQIVTDYESKLPDVCPGKIAFHCEPAAMMISIDGAEPVPCPSEPLEVDKGQHKIVGTYGSEKTNYVVDVKGLDTVRVELEVEVPYDIKPNLVGASTGAIYGIGYRDDGAVAGGGGPVEPPSEGSGLAIAGWTLTGVGAAALVTALVLDVAVLAPDVEDLEAFADANDRAGYDALAEDVESMQTINTALLIGGGALAITGAVLLIVDATSSGASDAKADLDDDSLLSDPSVQVYVGDEGAGLMLRANW